MKTIHFSRVILICLCAILLNSCDFDCERGRGAMTREARDPGAFSGIRMKIPAHMVIEQGEKAEFSIEAQPNILKMISTTLKEETLIIESTSCLGENMGINIYVRLPVFTKLVVEGSGDISSQGMLNSEQLGLVVDGSGHIDLQANSTLLFCGIKGSGDIKVKGSGKTEHIRIDGSGSYNGAGFQVSEANVSINGSAFASVMADSLLSADINGSGQIEYAGNPKMHQKINGSGGISRMK